MTTIHRRRFTNTSFGIFNYLSAKGLTRRIINVTVIPVLYSDADADEVYERGPLCPLLLLITLK